MERGLARGKQTEAQAVCLRQSRKRLGSVDVEDQSRIEQLPVERLEESAEALLDFTSGSDLLAWLDAHATR